MAPTLAEIERREQETTERAGRYDVYRTALDARFDALGTPIPPEIIEACNWELGEIALERDAIVAFARRRGLPGVGGSS